MDLFYSYLAVRLHNLCEVIPQSCVTRAMSGGTDVGYTRSGGEASARRSSEVEVAAESRKFSSILAYLDQVSETNNNSIPTIARSPCPRLRAQQQQALDASPSSSSSPLSSTLLASPSTSSSPSGRRQQPSSRRHYQRAKQQQQQQQQQGGRSSHHQDGGEAALQKRAGGAEEEDGRRMREVRRAPWDSSIKRVTTTTTTTTTTQPSGGGGGSFSSSPRRREALASGGRSQTSADENRAGRTAVMTSSTTRTPLIGGATSDVAKLNNRRRQAMNTRIDRRYSVIGELLSTGDDRTVESGIGGVGGDDDRTTSAPDKKPNKNCTTPITGTGAEATAAAAAAAAETETAAGDGRSQRRRRRWVWDEWDDNVATISPSAHDHDGAIGNTDLVTSRRNSSSSSGSSRNNGVTNRPVMIPTSLSVASVAAASSGATGRRHGHQTSTSTSHKFAADATRTANIGRLGSVDQPWALPTTTGGADIDPAIRQAFEDVQTTARTMKADLKQRRSDVSNSLVAFCRCIRACLLHAH